MKLGSCYYPEHWPENLWARDAERMRAMGLSLVRVGEFAWSRIEPEAGRLDWDWLDRAIDLLGDAGLEIILGTPTATPPKWLVDSMPDMVAVDAEGRPRRFGSRRHYCFSHRGYRAECRRIVTAMAERYGDHPAVTMWQTDNEYGCHDSVLSFSDAAAAAFRAWLEARYGTIDALNAVWGNVFWSMEYRAFAQVDPPHLTVTEANPAHWLAYRRFASDEVRSFNAEQVEILRAHSPGRANTHNFMGFFTEFDHHALGRDIDIASWDSYPLGFLEQFWFSEDQKRAFLRQGHPDIAGFHHDLYRGCAGGRWGVMEQQPGPVNWARFNPAPLPGMVALWTLEAFAHGAEFVNYFRWRQAPFAQEQMHAGLLRPDDTEAEAAHEAREAARVIAQLGTRQPAAAQVALVFDYEAAWVCGIQPQGESFRHDELTFAFYSALRRQGLDIDIVPPDADLAVYQAVIVPSLPTASEAFAQRLAALDCPVMIGPRSGSKTADFAIPEGLAPGSLRTLVPVKITRAESLRPGAGEAGDGWGIERWREDVETACDGEFVTDNGSVAVVRNGRFRYCAAWPDNRLLDLLVKRIAAEAGLECTRLPEGLRLRRTAGHVFAFNYSDHAIDTAPLDLGDPDIGARTLPPAGVAIWPTR
ncbi:beta-galactosidase [Qipengyuania nanhaisediminis]|uniref:beta-galactosidase n=1 Tax=Qipengyuania nanhaisediminis TaxID=604088 RepID=UPI0038B28239